MGTYKIVYYQNEQPRYFVFNALTKDEANQKWNDFKQTEEIYRGKITIHWSGTLDQWEEIQKKRFKK